MTSERVGAGNLHRLPVALPAQLCLFYQPFYNLYSDRLQGYEALVRHYDSLHDSYSTATSLIAQWSDTQLTAVDEWVVQEATQRLSVWRQVANDKNLILSINISLSSLHNASFRSFIEWVTGSAGIPLDRVLLDLPAATISTLSPSSETFDGINRLRSKGFSFCVDGLDHDNAELMRDDIWQLVDIAKLSPRTFLGDQATQSAALERLCDKLQRVDIPVVATGVESRAQLDLVRRLGCEWAQGFFLGEPALASELGVSRNLLTLTGPGPGA